MPRRRSRSGRGCGHRSGSADRHGTPARHIQNVDAARHGRRQEPRDRWPAHRDAGDCAQGRRRRTLHRKPARHDPLARPIDRTIRSMRKLFSALLFAACATPAVAQYTGPGVEVCRAYAERDVRKNSAKVQAVVFEKDRELNIDRYTAKVGSQFVSSLLYGNGAIVYGGGVPATEMTFVCLLADEKRAVFFHWFPRRDAPALTQCRRGGATNASQCLETLLNVTEQ